ncbi:calcium-binding protein [Dactylosporangium sp. NPDC049525]|uniref:calcium-binding protein n=1 Tax=Dactylosporangium sp. NPDC049525 TaxID=3154730 RepID=UPI0034424DDC
MASTRCAVRFSAVAAALMLSAVVGARPAAADFVVLADCFGNPIQMWSVLSVPAGAGSFYGTPGDDVIMGTDGPDIIHGMEGRDVICGGGGDDIIWGEEGNDHIDGEAGGDYVNGDEGNDHLYGGANAASVLPDLLIGGDGVDELFGEGGPDRLVCGSGTGASDIPWDVGDFADGGTGMPAGQPESDELWGGCDTAVNIP